QFARDQAGRRRARCPWYRADWRTVRDVCVVGLGLIGGSVLRAAAKADRQVWGAAASDEDVAAARADGFDATTSLPDALARAAERDAIVVLAVPLTAVDAVLRQVAEHAPGVLPT